MVNIRKTGIVVCGVLCAALFTGCGTPQSSPTVQQPQPQPQVLQTAAPVPPVSAPSTEKKVITTGQAATITFQSGVEWFTGQVTANDLHAAEDAGTLIKQLPDPASWLSAYVTSVQVVITAVSRERLTLPATAFNALSAQPRPGVTLRTASTALLAPVGCKILPQQVPVSVGETLTFCITTFTPNSPVVAVPSTPVPSTPAPSTSPPVLGPPLDAVFIPDGRTQPVVIWANGGSIPPATYQ